MGATKRAFGPIEELAQALLTDCRHGATCLHCLRDRTEELLDSLVTLGTIAEKERGVCNAFPAFKRFVRYLQAEKKLIRKIAASEAQAVSTLITAALRASPYVRREPGAAEARLRRQLGTLNAGAGLRGRRRCVYRCSGAAPV